jgi:hypothetical protein
MALSYFSAKRTRRVVLSSTIVAASAAGLLGGRHSVVARPRRHVEGSAGSVSEAS